MSQLQPTNKEQKRILSVIDNEYTDKEKIFNVCKDIVKKTKQYILVCNIYDKITIEYEKYCCYFYDKHCEKKFYNSSWHLKWESLELEQLFKNRFKQTLPNFQFSESLQQEITDNKSLIKVCFSPIIDNESLYCVVYEDIQALFTICNFLLKTNDKKSIIEEWFESTVYLFYFQFKYAKNYFKNKTSFETKNYLQEFIDKAKSVNNINFLLDNK